VEVFDEVLGGTLKIALRWKKAPASLIHDGAVAARRGILAGASDRAMTANGLQIRTARLDELAALNTLMDLAIGELLKPFLTETEIMSSRTIMGLDTQLVKDGTYFAVEADGVLAGCGGWSRRATIYGGDVTPGRDPALLDPARDAARVRAMYTHPAFVRRGVGRMILARCEETARAEGFIRAELVATMAGLPLYRACGYQVVERFTDDRGGAPVPLARMMKAL
jgi:GNAT superfamily N-acetyltransferase